MAYYTVKFTDTTKDPIKVNDSTINTETSLALPGRNQRGYGPSVAENFLHLLENFANTTEPDNPVIGQIWYNTTEGVEDLLVWDGSSWKSSGSVKKTANTPESAILGDLWVDTDNQQLFLFNGASWVLVGPTFSSGLRTGVVAETIVDVNDLIRVVLKTYIDDEVVSIYSVDSFIPKVTINGFASIESGINLSNKDFDENGVIGTKYWGISEKAENLIVGNTVVPASSFLRKDVANITTAAFTVKNDVGISTGEESQLKLSVDSNGVGSLYHSIPDSALDLRVNYSGNVATVLRADATTGNVGIGVNNIAPAYSLDVLGTGRFTGILRSESTSDTTDSAGASLRVLGGAKIDKKLSVVGLATLRRGLTVGSYDNEITLDLASRDAISPLATNTFDIGTTDNKFRNIYATNFYGNVVGDITGNISGTSNVANRLTAGTTFQMTGQVIADSFTFDGATGGTVKVFETEISPTFIADQETTFTDVNGSDLLLIYRTGAGLGKTLRNTFLTKIATIPIGTILPYAGATPPDGYLFCDGSEKERGDYNDLFNVIGYTYGNVSDLQGSTTFRLPDLRGRFAMGRNSMDNADTVVDPSGVIDSNTQDVTPILQATEATAGILGNVNGQDQISLDVENIPTHKHLLTGDAGTQFYATNNDTGIPDDTGSFVGNGPSATNQGQYLPNTGEMIDASRNPLNSSEFLVTAFNIMNPYLTINYIIFTGKFS